MTKLIAKFIIFIFITFGCIACFHIRTDQESYDLAYTKPPETNDGWNTAGLSDVGLDSHKIKRLLYNIQKGEIKNIYAVIVVKDGLLVVDEYFNGANRTNIGLIASTTKSLVSLLLGIALDESTSNKNVNTPLQHFFPAYLDRIQGNEKEAITLYHVLTMTAGLDWDESTYPHPHERNPNTQMYSVADPVGFILDRDVNSPPGKCWNYNSGLSVLLGEVVRNLTGEYIDVFAEKRLFSPLQFTRYQWGKHENGTVWSNGDLYIRPRDLAKVGQLVLDNGKWNGQQIVSEKWIRESTRPHTEAHYGLKYGYQWWLGSARYAERQLEVIFGSGTGGQKLFIIPEVDMVVVVLSKVFKNKGGQNRATRVLTDYVLPASLPEFEHQGYEFDPIFAKAVAGKYVNAVDDQVVHIKTSGNSLYAKPTLFSRFELKPFSRKSFYGHWGPIGDVYIDFIENDTGKVTAAAVHYLLGTMNFRKMN
jgi:CubicO group peptidase (beta-lactamase class C family)